VILEFLTQAGAHAAGFGGPAEMWGAIVNDFSNITSPAAMAAFVQVLMIDIMLAGDNAIVVGALAAGLPADQRRKVILIGIVAALVLRIVFRGQCQSVDEHRRAGARRVDSCCSGCRGRCSASSAMPAQSGRLGLTAEHDGIPQTKTFLGAAWAVAVADVSMSLDNVLAVAGAAREHPGILVIGLLLSVALMGIAANFIARYIERYRWIAYVGLVVILYVAAKMIWEGWVDPSVGIGTLFG
jgi:predicted tellurium resistance membrane protein TerC